MKRQNSFYLAAVASLVLIAFAVRAASLDTQSLWRDEVDALLFATAPWEDVLSNFTRVGWNGPFYHLLLRGWIALTGTSEYAMRFLSLIFGVLCVPLAYVLGRRMFNRQAGLVAALLVAASPYLVWYSQEVKMYTLVAALALLSIYALSRALSGSTERAEVLSKGRAVDGKGWHWWAVQITATSLAFYAHILAALLIPVQVLIYLTWWPQARRRWLGALIALACLILPYLPQAGWQMELLFQDSVRNSPRQSPDQIVETLLANWRAGNFLLLRTRVTGFTRYELIETARILLNGWSMGYFGSFGWGWPWGVVLMGGLVAWGLLSFFFPSGGWKKELRKRLSLLCWLVVPVLTVWYVSNWQPLFTDRYFIWSGLAFYLLIAVGLAALWQAGGWRRGAAVLLLGLVLGFNGIDQYQQATSPGKADFRAAAAYVAAGYETVGVDEPVVRASPPPPGCESCAFKTYLPLALSRYCMYEGLIVFQIPHGRYTFDYYFPYKDYPWAEGLYTNHRYPDGSYMMNAAAAAEAMEGMMEDYDVVWLVASESEMWDERGLVKGWLDANMRLTDKVEGEYLWVDVYRYER